LDLLPQGTRRFRHTCVCSSWSSKRTTSAHLFTHSTMRFGHADVMCVNCSAKDTSEPQPRGHSRSWGQGGGG
jgi:hypothetical protein